MFLFLVIGDTISVISLLRTSIALLSSVRVFLVVILLVAVSIITRPQRRVFVGQVQMIS